MDYFYDEANSIHTYTDILFNKTSSSKNTCIHFAACMYICSEFTISISYGKFVKIKWK